MSFDPNHNHSITLTEAGNMTEAFRVSNPTEKIGGFFGKKAIQDILDQTDCVGLKFYFARNNGDLTLVVCGAKANQDDLYNGELAEFSYVDPPYSSSSNPLNS